MTTTQTPTAIDIDGPGAPILRRGEPKKRDRRPVVRYGPRGRAGEDGYSQGERLLLAPPDYLSGDGLKRYLLGTIPADDTDRPIGERHSIARLVSVCLTQRADILLDGNKTDRDVRSVLAELSQLLCVQLIDASAQTTRTTTYESLHEGYRDLLAEDERDMHVGSIAPTAGQEYVVDCFASDGVHRALGVADLPARNAERAREVASALAEKGWRQQRIRDYLTLHGFENPCGTIGSWHRRAYQELVS